MAQLKASTAKSVYKNNISYYPRIFQFFEGFTEEFWLTEPQPTRGKALTIAKRYIKNNINN